MSRSPERSTVCRSGWIDVFFLADYDPAVTLLRIFDQVPLSGRQPHAPDRAALESSAWPFSSTRAAR